jgi:hypothetical protein
MCIAQIEFILIKQRKCAYDVTLRQVYEIMCVVEKQ